MTPRSDAPAASSAGDIANGTASAPGSDGPAPGASAAAPRFFETPAAFRDWLEANHETATELWVGFRKVATGHASITWPESVDEALCFGWIDGVRKRLDDASYVIRFTPRRPSSVWSTANTRRAAELSAEGRMRPAGLRALAARSEARTGVYSFEHEAAELPPAFGERLRGDKVAWAYWTGQPPGYRRVAAHWVSSAKREETRVRRFETLLEDCRAGRRLAVVTLGPRTGAG